MKLPDCATSRSIIKFAVGAGLAETRKTAVSPSAIGDEPNVIETIGLSLPSMVSVNALEVPKV